MEYDYKEDLKIDENALDVEWLEQAELFVKYSDLLVEAKKEAKFKAEATKVLEAKLMMEARETGGATSDTSAKAYCRRHPDYDTAKKEEIEAEYTVDLLDGAVFAFHQRKVVLENLSRLVTAGYFAMPESPRDLNAEAEKFRKLDRKKVVEGIKGRKAGRRVSRRK